MAFDFPAGPTNGQTVLVNGKTYTYSTANSRWEGSGFGQTGVATTQPASPTDGVMWFDKASGTLNVYDGTASAWKPAKDYQVTTPAPTTRVGGGALAEGDLYYDTALNSLFAYDGAAWQGIPVGNFVGKDSALATGAALIPAGLDAERPAAPTDGMMRFNTDSGSFEGYVAASSEWKKIQYVPPVTVATDLIPNNGDQLPAGGVYRSIIINAGVTVTVPGICALDARDITINGTIVGDGLGSAGGGQTSGSTSESTNVGFGIAGIGGIAYGFQSLFGTGGTSGGYTVTGGTAAGGQSGSAGAALVLKATDFITVGATASISCSGTDANVGIQGGVTRTTGGAGGGSGGLILLQAAGDVTLAAGSTLTANGGNGSAALGNTAQSAPGGGGGGGGWVVLNSSGTLTNNATISTTGGTGGAARNTAPESVPSGTGGAWAGSGGLPDFPSGGNGGAGITVIGAFI